MRTYNGYQERPDRKPIPNPFFLFPHIEAHRYISIDAEGPPPVWGGSCMGRYEMVEGLIINSHPVFRHEYFDLYIFIKLDGVYCVGPNLDTVDRCQMLLYPNTFAPLVWNILEERYYSNILFSWKFDFLAPPISFNNADVPCKVDLSSSGSLGDAYPEQMGIYYLQGKI